MRHLHMLRSLWGRINVMVLNFTWGEGLEPMLADMIGTDWG